MTTAGWVALCVLGVVVGYIFGWTRRRRAQERGDIAAGTPRGAPSTTVARRGEDHGTPTGQDHDARTDDHDAAPKGEDHDARTVAATGQGGAGEAAVIDLRVVPAPPSDVQETQPEPDPAPEAAPRLSLASTTGVAVAERAEDQDAQVIDLAAAARTAVALHNLQFLAGIGPRLDKRLRANGIVTVQDLAATRRKVLRRLIADHLPEDEATRLLDDARALLELAARGRTAPADPGQELRRIQGIGTTMMRWLETQGVVSLDQLAGLTKHDIDRLEAALTDYPGRIRAEKWRGQARRLVPSSTG